MRVHAEFDKRVLIHTDEVEWQASPMPGVDRRLLDRIGEEVARATSIVRYAPGSSFSAHTHTGGEEFIVLEGIFQDEHGDYPSGSYVRNPPESRHTPASAPGTTIFVKLWQFDLEDRTHVRIDLTKIGAVNDPARPGVSITPLFKDHREEVRLEHWAPGAEVGFVAEGGAELLLLEGSATESGDTLRRHSWLRLPDGASLSARAGPEGAKVWLKTGHLRNVTAPGA
ncbi:MAG: cupin domain-containing protein [Pseudomonadota bacterium]